MQVTEFYVSELMPRHKTSHSYHLHIGGCQVSSMKPIFTHFSFVFDLFFFFLNIRCHQEVLRRMDEGKFKRRLSEVNARAVSRGRNELMGEF